MASTVRGHIEQLPSGSFRVHVYAGTDPVTGRPRRLKETCPDEPTAAAALGRLLNEADGGRFPNRAATLDKYLEVTDLELSTREAHQGYIRRTIGPVLGDVKVRKLGGVAVPEDAYAFSPDPVEPRHHDPPIPPVCPQNRHHQLAEGTAALLRYPAPQAGTDLNTVAGRLGHAEGSTTLRFYAQLTRPADRNAAAVIPSQLDGLRKREQLRDLYRQQAASAGADDSQHTAKGPANPK